MNIAFFFLNGYFFFFPLFFYFIVLFSVFPIHCDCCCIVSIWWPINWQRQWNEKKTFLFSLSLSPLIYFFQMLCCRNIVFGGWFLYTNLPPAAYAFDFYNDTLVYIEWTIIFVGHQKIWKTKSVFCWKLTRRNKIDNCTYFWHKANDWISNAYEYNSIWM